MQGRPVGKRVTGRFFLDHVLEHGIEACDYLLAVDVDLDPLAGYQFTNWETGYGDVVAMPDLATLRLLPWLEGSAMVVCDLSRPDGAVVEVAPRRILEHQVERARAMGFEVRCAPPSSSSTSSSESFEEAAAKGWRDLHPHVSTIEDYQLLQTAREEYVLRRVRNEMLDADIPVEFSKGEAGRGQHEVNVTYGHAHRSRRPPSRLQERRQGDRRSVWAGGLVHGQVVDGRGGLVVPHPRQPVGRRLRCPLDGGRRRTRRDYPKWAGSS